MTALSCLALGVAFLVAVGLLVLAGVLLGWVIPEPHRAGAGPAKRARPPNRG